jgi:hypothetical protein
MLFAGVFGFIHGFAAPYKQLHHAELSAADFLQDRGLRRCGKGIDGGLYGLRPSAAGIAAGFVAALLLTRAMTSMLVGIKPTDPPTFSAMAMFFLLIAALATWVPARRPGSARSTERVARRVIS